MSKKKSIAIFCYSCDLDATVKVSEDDVRSINIDTLYCPFCGSEIEASDEDTEEDVDTERREDDY